MTSAAILLILASVGATFIVTRSWLFEDLRADFIESEAMTTLLSCPQCFGFWANLVFSPFCLPFVSCGLFPFVVFAVGTSFAASGICYIINSFIEK